jgi:hypothetical protein
MFSGLLSKWCIKKIICKIKRLIYNSPAMRKRKLLLSILFVVALIFAGLGVNGLLQKRAERNRQIGYQSILKEFSAALPVGSERREVESLLVVRNRAFQRMCCIASENRNAQEDLVKIGTEPKPWYCSDNSVYLVFEFDSMSHDGPGQSDPSERLRRIEVKPWLGGCL